MNSSANDFCPTISRDGHLFYFVSNRAGGCGGDDIYTTRFRPDGWDPVANLGCEVNSSANEASPFPLLERASGPVLYFSSTRAGTSDIYQSESHGNLFGPAEPIAALNSSSAHDGHPNVRRDGLEIFFFSTRPGTLGAQDIYSSTRPSTSDPWSAPVNLGALVNSAAADTRPSPSWDGTTLYFGSTRTGGFRPGRRGRRSAASAGRRWVRAATSSSASHPPCSPGAGAESGFASSFRPRAGAAY